LANYRSKGVISSWFSSFGDAGSAGNELREVQVSRKELAHFFNV
jgi:hypothetical protein